MFLAMYRYSALGSGVARKFSRRGGGNLPRGCKNLKISPVALPLVLGKVTCKHINVDVH